MLTSGYFLRIFLVKVYINKLVFYSISEILLKAGRKEEGLCIIKKDRDIRLLIFFLMQSMMTLNHHEIH